MIIDISNHMHNMHMSQMSHVSCFRTWKRVLHITTGILLLQSLDVFHPCPICPGVKNGSLVRGYGGGKLFGLYQDLWISCSPGFLSRIIRILHFLLSVTLVPARNRVTVRIMRGWQLSTAQSEGGASQHYLGSHKPFTSTAAALKPLRLRCCLSDGERTISSPFDFDWMVHLNRKFGANFRYILSSDFTFIRLVVKQCAVLFLWTFRYLFLSLILVLHCQYQLMVKSWNIRWCVMSSFWLRYVTFVKNILLCLQCMVCDSWYCMNEPDSGAAAVELVTFDGAPVTQCI